jgi:hypothetical protein
MTRAQEYASLAANLRARASRETSAYIKAEWDHLAYCYELLAEQAEKSPPLDASFRAKSSAA